MHPELRLVEDFMTDRGVLTLPALPRMLFVVRGSITAGRRTARMGETLYSEDAITAHAEETGATLWRWELSDPRQPAAKMQQSKRLLARQARADARRPSPRAICSGAATAWRSRRAVAPICIAIKGPGIRCVIEGSLRVDTNGQSHTYGVGDAWFESGTRAGVRAGRRTPTRFIRVMILPRALIGKSSIQYVNEEDKDKPKSQQYRVFVDAPLTGATGYSCSTHLASANAVPMLRDHARRLSCALFVPAPWAWMAPAHARCLRARPPARH